MEEKKTVYDEIYLTNKDYQNETALEFFHSKYKYKELFAKIEETKKALENYGVKKGDFVTICAAGIPETTYLFYALSKIGAIGNFIPPYFSEEDFIKRLNECETKHLFVIEPFYDLIKDKVKYTGIKNVILIPSLNSSILRYFVKKLKINDKNVIKWNDFIKDGAYSLQRKDVAYEKEMPLAMVYSSGTTGASKGILLSHDSFENSVAGYRKSSVDLKRGQRFYQLIPIWFSTGLSTSMHLPLSCGNTIFMDPRFEKDIFIKNLQNKKITTSLAPASMYEGFLEPGRKKKNLSHLIYPFQGGEPLTKELAEEIEKVFKESNCNSKIMSGYGQCEAGATIATQSPTNYEPRNSVGKPLEGIEIRIVDDEFNDLPANTRGNIIVNTGNRMIGYYKNEEATKEYFHDENGKRYNCTKDIGYLDENGNLYVEGRASDYSLIDGEKVYNFDIEKVLRKNPKIKNVDVVFSSDNELTAHIILQDDCDNISMEDIELMIGEIYNEYNNLNYLPTKFKIRETFPSSPSGKRDVETMKKEEDDFIKIEKYKIKEKVLKLKRL